jgi:hypothetical protein
MFIEYSIISRQLRPEFCINYDKKLSADALTKFAEDDEIHGKNLKEAQEYLLDVAIPQAAKAIVNSYKRKAQRRLLNARRLIDEVHRRGVNIRHLGRIRKYLLDNYSRDMDINAIIEIMSTEMICRVLKNILNEKMRIVGTTIKEPSLLPFQEVIANFYNKWISEADYRKGEIQRAIEATFNLPPNTFVQNGDDWNTEVNFRAISVVQRLSEITGVKLHSAALKEIEKKSFSGHRGGVLLLQYFDIKEVQATVKNMNIVSFAQGVELLLLSRDQLRPLQMANEYFARSNLFLTKNKEKLDKWGECLYKLARALNTRRSPGEDNPDDDDLMRVYIYSASEIFFETKNLSLLAKLANFAIRTINLSPDFTDEHLTVAYQDLSHMLEEINNFATRESALLKSQKDFYCHWIFIGYCYSVTKNKENSAWVQSLCNLVVESNQYKWMKSISPDDLPRLISLIFNITNTVGDSGLCTSKRRGVVSNQILDLIFPLNEFITIEDIVTLKKNFNITTIITTAYSKKSVLYSKDMYDREIADISIIIKGRGAREPPISTLGTGPLLDLFKYHSINQLRDNLKIIKRMIPMDLFEDRCNEEDDLETLLYHFDDPDLSEGYQEETVLTLSTNLFQVYTRFYKNHENGLTNNEKKRLNNGFKCIVSFMVANEIYHGDLLSEEGKVLEWYKQIRARTTQTILNDVEMLSELTTLFQKLDD